MTSKYHKTKSGKMARKGLWYNIQQKKKRIAAGSGEKIRKPGSKGAPTAKKKLINLQKKKLKK
jgi:hypothetical protein